MSGRIRFYFFGFFILLLILGILASICRAADSFILDPQEAFILSGSTRSNKEIVLNYHIEEGYYLYKSKFEVISLSESTLIGDPIFFGGEKHTDDFFGETVVFRNATTIVVPLIKPIDGKFQILVTAQGCTDSGFCFIPFDTVVDIYAF